MAGYQQAARNSSAWTLSSHQNLNNSIINQNLLEQALGHSVHCHYANRTVFHILSCEVQANHSERLPNENTFCTANHSIIKVIK
jgi:hypothetical protein